VTTPATPATVAVPGIALFQPRQPFLKSLVAKPAEHGERLQYPGRQPRHGLPSVSARKTSLTRSGFQERLSRGLEAGVIRIRAPLDRRQ
jgi:hypothetical protein